jgi:hypothetical protein
VDNINERIIKSRKKVEKFSFEESLIGIVLLIGSAKLSQQRNHFLASKIH